MQLAEAIDSTPVPVAATSFDPYGQIVKMLMPRAQSIAIYDRMGLPIWLNEGLDSPELHRLLQHSLTEELRPGSHEEGFAEPSTVSTAPTCSCCAMPTSSCSGRSAR